MITDKERLELEYLLNKEARKYNELFESKIVSLHYIPDWIDYQCFDDLGHALRPKFLIVICTGRRCILHERRKRVEKEHITRYYPIIERFFSS
ncbi:hypothetical protein [Paenibacillus larvae]|uniref:Uncharacterized protein n=1 Tax=Paenibacillus larvae subsp. larvae DSM 25430 TaxID=697284 RepID=V9W129_9BACL|nr:hypothetical protein [Paenibacillus larvae]AHD04691.1 hypothetical protein ERIC2_c08580 [Paenibacillus larvae subsp. larvae DSM 25430]MDR5566974.1 hypothetical protein [Paenibacillus larvae]MDR5595030.1 hypothetical protein [Paenibacillus larvae]